MSRQTEISYKTVDFLRFPLIMAVVLIHCDYPANTLCDVRDTAPVFFAIQQFFQHHIYTVAVPLFFFISGYLFFRNGIPDANGLRNKVTARVHTLLIPYLLWNTAGMLLFLLKAGPLLGFFPQYADFGHTIPGTTVRDSRYTLKKIAVRIFLGRTTVRDSGYAVKR